MSEILSKTGLQDLEEEQDALLPSVSQENEKDSEENMEL